MLVLHLWYFRSTRYVDNTDIDKILDDRVIEETLTKVFDEFSRRFFPAVKPTEKYLFETNLNILYETMGFKICKIQSELQGGGFGVGVLEGKIPEGTVAAIYPGMQYKLQIHHSLCTTLLLVSKAESVFYPNKKV